MENLYHVEKASDSAVPTPEQSEELHGKILMAYQQLANIKALVTQEHSRLRKKIFFFNRGLVFNGDTLKNKPLGGIETALINMARELHNLGYDVKVFCNCDRPGTYDGVQYLDTGKFDRFNRNSGPDYFISAGNLEPFMGEINSPTKILWTQDAYDQPFLQPLAEQWLWRRIDKIFTVSNWQASTFMEYFNIPRDKFYITKNGIDKISELARKKVLNSNTWEIIASEWDRELLYLSESNGGKIHEGKRIAQQNRSGNRTRIASNSKSNSKG